MAKQTLYRSYLLRLWRETENTPWRITLEAPSAGELIAFARLTDLFVFLEEETNEHIRTCCPGAKHPDQTDDWVIQ